MSNPAKLEFYRADTLTPVVLGDLGTEYRNTSNNILPIIIANTGGRDAIDVKARFVGYQKPDGTIDNISKDWKQIAYDNSSIYRSELDLPNIPSGKFMPGYKVYSESFDSIIGQYLPQDWDTKGTWEVYFLTENNKQNSYLQHLVDDANTTTGKVTPMHYPKSKNCDLNVDIAVQKYNFGGIQLRVDDEGYGYFIIVYPDPATIEKVNNYYSTIIPNYTPIDPNYEAAIGVGKGKFTDLDNFDNFNIYNKCHWFSVGTGSVGLQRDTLRVELIENVITVSFNGNSIGKYIDTNAELNEGRMALIAGRRYGSVVIFDNVEYKTQTERGILFVRSIVPSDPSDSQEGDNIYYSSLLIEYSE